MKEIEGEDQANNRYGEKDKRGKNNKDYDIIKTMTTKSKKYHGNDWN